LIYKKKPCIAQETGRFSRWPYRQARQAERAKIARLSLLALDNRVDKSGQALYGEAKWLIRKANACTD
jgi:hypothetical protein